MADVLSVVEAWSAVMGDVREIGKNERNKAQGFSFRGIDTTVNAVGPVLRKHGVVVTPYPEDITTSTYETAKGTTMFSAIVKMRYTVRGPAGDSFDGGAFGEAADAGDKAVSKAQSVAYRVFLLQGLTIPTDEPDPDSESHERAEPARQRSRQAPAEDRPLPAAVAAFVAAANALDASARAEIRAKLIAAGLPSAPAEMSEEQGLAACDLLAAMKGDG